MKRTLIYLISLFATLSITAQVQKWQKQAHQSQVTVFAWNAAGEMQQAQGVWIDAAGHAATQYDIMKGAVRASITDAKGKEYKVVGIYGASSLYNTAVLATDAKKTTAPTIYTVQPVAGEHIWLMPTSKADAKVPATQDSITRIDQFNEVYNYITLSKPLEERQIGVPVMNAAGEMIGITQAAGRKDTKAYVIDIRYARQLRVGVMDARRADYRDIPITKTLPDDANEALTYIYLYGTQDTLQYLSMTDAFIAQHPTVPTGYTLKAEMLCEQGRYDAAEATYQNALKVKGIAQNQILFSMSRMMYQASSRNPSPYPAWTLQTALETVNRAIADYDQPIYHILKAHCLFAQKNYLEAENEFLYACTTNMRSAENFTYAAQCRQMRGDSVQNIIALQDSALACYTKPYPKEAAPILLLRAVNLTQAGRKREAIADYNTYEHLTGSSSLTYLFYYEREQLEAQCRMYPAALNDIERAIKLNPGEAILYAELASLNYRVNQLDDAERAARDAIKVNDKLPDAWRILGVIMRDKGKPEESRKALEKAAELGDDIAAKLLQ